MSKTDLTNKERLELVKKLLVEMVDNWNEDEVEEYPLQISFDEFVCEFVGMRFK